MVLCHMGNLVGAQEWSLMELPSISQGSQRRFALAQASHSHATDGALEAGSQLAAPPAFRCTPSQ